MDNTFLRELSALLQETEKLLACSEPDGEAWQGYGRVRREVFARLEAAGPLAVDGEGERAALRELIGAILERDKLLMRKLDACMAYCREELSALPQTRRALKGYLPPQAASRLQRQA